MLPVIDDVDEDGGTENAPPAATIVWCCDRGDGDNGSGGCDGGGVVVMSNVDNCADSAGRSGGDANRQSREVPGNLNASATR